MNGNILLFFFSLRLHRRPSEIEPIILKMSMIYRACTALIFVSLKALELMRTCSSFALLCEGVGVEWEGAGGARARKSGVWNRKATAKEYRRR